MLFLNSQPLKRHKDVPSKCINFIFIKIILDLDVLPDGAVKFLIANDEKLSYILQINDLRVQEYHRFFIICYFFKINFYLLKEIMVLPKFL